MKNQNFDIFILTMCRWDDVYSSTIYSIAKELSNTHRVFYIDHPFTVKDFISQYRSPRIQNRKAALLHGKNPYRKIEGLPDNFNVVTPRLTLSINALPEGRLYNFLSNRNDRIVYQSIRQTIADFGVKKFVFINSFDPFYCCSLPDDIKPLLHVYQSTDDISQEKYIAKHGIRLEQEALLKAHLNLATSRELTRKLSTQATKVQYLPNAANFELFHQAATEKYDLPDELKTANPKGNSPMVGYIGDISHLRIDFNLLTEVVKSHPDKLFVFIGKKQCTDAELPPQPNMLFIPPKPIERLPAYLQHFDCCIIPFQCNTLTKSIYPLKVNEYLSAGKPVVSTAFSEDIRMFNSVIHLKDNPKQFATSIQEAIITDTPKLQQQRIESASKNSWKVRTQELLQLIEKRLAINEPQTFARYEPLKTTH
jgi:teichuronic acid biosynthesis glycosyltransferase TuaH